MNEKQFQKCMNESVKEIDGVTVIKECGEWYCNYEDYLMAKKPSGKEDFCNWCNNNKVNAVSY